MTDYILITSVTAEKLFGIFEESVRKTCAKDYSAVQIDAWIARATPARWQQLLSGDLHFIAAVNQTSGELAGFASINPDGYLHSMFVRPRYQKKGIASIMLHALEDWVMRFQASDIYSEVSITALPFFLSQGFSIERERLHRFLAFHLFLIRLRLPDGFLREHQ